MTRNRTIKKKIPTPQPPPTTLPPGTSPAAALRALAQCVIELRNLVVSQGERLEELEHRIETLEYNLHPRIIAPPTDLIYPASVPGDHQPPAAPTETAQTPANHV